jgi:hypothetical protein
MAGSVAGGREKLKPETRNQKPEGRKSEIRNAESGFLLVSGFWFLVF